MAETLKDFLVGIGFDVDKPSQSKAEAAVKATEAKMTKSAEEASARRSRTDADEAAAKAKHRQKALKDEAEGQSKSLKGLQSYAVKASGFALTAFAAIQASALGVVYAVDRAAKSFEKLNYAGQRAGSSASKLTGFGYAASQLGSSREEAEGQLQGFGQRLKTNGPGYSRALARLGIKTRDDKGNMRDSADIATDLGDALRKMQSRGQYGYANAQNQASIFGFEGDTFRALMNPDFRKREGQFGADQKKIGADPNDAAKSGTAFEQSMRHLEEVLGAIGTKIDSVLFQKLKPLLDQLAEWFTANGERIGSIIARIADDLVKLAKAIAEQIAGADWNKILDNIEGLAKAFGSVVDKLNGKAGLLALIVGLGVGLKALVMPAWLKTLLGLSVATDLAIPNEQKPGMTKRWDDAAGGLPGDLSSSDMSEADKRAGASRKGFGRRGFGQRDSRGDDVTVTDESIPTEGKALLNTLASGEAHGYNVINGGSTFSNYSRHPYEGMSTNRGGRAAGRYQFLPSTWASLQGKLGLKDFSPVNQDKAAYYLARRDYRARTGRDLQADLKDPSRRAMIGRVLHPTWTSLNGSFASKYDHFLSKQESAPAVKTSPMLKARPIPAMPDNIKLLPGEVLGADGKTVVLKPQHTSSRGVTNVTHNPTFHIAGGDPNANMQAARLSASRGQQDLLRNVQGALA